MWIRIVAVVLSLFLSLAVSYGQVTKTTPDQKRVATGARTKVASPEIVNLLPVMRSTSLREGRNPIHTTRSGTRLIAVVREGSVVGYEAVNSRGELLSTTVVPDPFEAERARAWKEGMERAARNAAERRHCLELLGFTTPPPIQKSCMVVILSPEGGHGFFWLRCPKGI